MAALAARAGSETNPDPEEQERASLRWKILQKTPTSAALLHRGDRGPYEAQTGFIDQDCAPVAVTLPDIQACEVWRPDIGLGQGGGAA